MRRRRVGYADPPYLGCGKLYPQHSESKRWDSAESHGELMQSMDREFDAWAMSASSASLSEIMGLSPNGVRVAAWVKPFCSFKPGVSPAYTWEPVVYRVANLGDRKVKTIRDHFVSDVCSANITLKKGLVGAKPPDFCFWLFDLLGMKPDDEFVDLYPGTGGVTEAWKRWSHRKRTGLVVTGPLFEEANA